MTSPVNNTIHPTLQRLFSSPPGPCTVVMPETPKSSKTRAKKFRKDVPRFEKPHSPTNKPCFASGSFTDSPSARSVPPPPTTWIVEDFSSDTSGHESDSNCSSTDSCSLRDDLMKSPVFNTNESSSPIFGNKESSPVSPGIRVTPMQLIAAIVSA